MLSRLRTLICCPEAWLIFQPREETSLGEPDATRGRAARPDRDLRAALRPANRCRPDRLKVGPITSAVDQGTSP